MDESIPFDADLSSLSDVAPAEGDPDEIWVTTFSGYQLPVQNVNEQQFYERLRDQYKASFSFTDPSDILDVDQVLIMELSVVRLSTMLARNRDANGDPMTPAVSNQVTRQLRDTRTALAKMKTDLGISRASRAEGEEDPAEYLQTLVRSAREFGMHRLEQVNLAIALMYGIVDVAGTWKRSDEFERSKTPYRTAEDIVDWILSADVHGKLVEHDKAFRENKQRLWIGKL